MYLYKFVLKGNKDFNFWSTAFSHGWVSLLPFSSNEEERSISYCFNVGGRKLVKTTIRGKGKNDVQVLSQSNSKLTEKEKEKVKSSLESCLQIDQDLSKFYKVCRKNGLGWAEKIGAGRLLRCPTFFEDIVKTICTTNCTWGQTKNMVARLCQNFGEKFDDENFTFPQPADIAKCTLKCLNEKIRAGYRTPYILEFAQNVSSGKINPEKWREEKIETLALKKELMSIKGVGEYAATNLLKLLGRFDEFTLDSWMGKKLKEKYFLRGKITKEKVEKLYKDFGEYKGMAMWLDLTKEFLIKRG
jgi:3-methyladenine DNA glycosylase/8-oxoguanine DNA glycosylase